MDNILNFFTNQTNTLTGDNGILNVFNMTSFWSCLAPYFFSLALAYPSPGDPQESQAQSQLQFPSCCSFTDISRGIQKEIQAAKQPIDETIFFIGSSQCSNVKRILGVEYDQIGNKSEPDLSQLALKLFTPSYNVTYALGVAARYIRRDAQYRADGKLVIFIHGFTDDPSKESFRQISKAFSFLEHGNNVMALDGSSLIKWLYLRSTTYIRFIGERLGATLAVMVEDGIDPDNVHIIGHSLGAHIAGFTGRKFFELTGRTIGRISGLDPAGPCFSHVEPELRLGQSYASFVDVVHTDAGVYGIKDAVGHVDYFPNSGSSQPSCLFQTCSHSRAWLLFAESIVNTTVFPAVKCDSWERFRAGDCDYDDISYMGYGASPSSRGLYFMQTNEDPPYGRGPAGLNFTNNEAILTRVGYFLG